MSNLPFRHQNKILYEQLQMFAKDLYTFSGKLPEFEKYGIIKDIRTLAGNLVEEFAVGYTRTSETRLHESLDHCLIIIAKITALIDLCLTLEYITSSTHSHLVFQCEEITKPIYEARKTSKEKNG